MKQDKGLVKLHGLPLIQHVISRISSFVNEIIIVVGTPIQQKTYSNTLKGNIKIIQDKILDDSPLIGAITGLTETKGDYVLIVACDMPFIQSKVIEYLFKEAENTNGAIFQHPNGWVEPLLAVYKKEPTLKTAKKLYKEGNMRIRYILLETNNVKYIPIQKLTNLDPKHLSLFDVDTNGKLKQAQDILQKNRNN
jgi:molybdopterin-guanine dinucleotide biosynthesis protein A